MNAYADRLKIRLPLIQAPMAGAQGSAMALAVGAAGAGDGAVPPLRRIRSDATNTSSRVMRPPGPVPVNVDRSTPSSPASIRTAGAARPPSPASGACAAAGGAGAAGG